MLVMLCGTQGSGSPARRSLVSSPLPGGSLEFELDEVDATHRGCHRFVPRHPGELAIEISDPIYVEVEEDDLWCEGINLRTKQRGIFPTAYATDLSILDDGLFRTVTCSTCCHSNVRFSGRVACIAWMRHFATDVARSVVCVSVCMSVCLCGGNTDVLCKKG